MFDAGLGIRLIETQIWLGVAISALMLGLMRYQRSPVAPRRSARRDRCRSGARDRAVVPARHKAAQGRA
jgi:hypothetical protein